MDDQTRAIHLHSDKHSFRTDGSSLPPPSLLSLTHALFPGYTHVLG
jgi:hypothetical protein